MTQNYAKAIITKQENDMLQKITMSKLMDTIFFTFESSTSFQDINILMILLNFITYGIVIIGHQINPFELKRKSTFVW